MDDKQIVGEITPELVDKVFEALDESDRTDFGMTKYQIEKFIIGAEPTPLSQYRQCLKELSARAEAIRAGCIKLKKLENEYNEDYSLDVIGSLEKRLQIQAQKKSLEAAQREFVILSEILDKLRDQIDDFDWEKHQPEYWQARLLQECKLHLMTQGRIPIEVLKAVNLIGDGPAQKFVEVVFGGHRNAIDTQQKS